MLTSLCISNQSEANSLVKYKHLKISKGMVATFERYFYLSGTFREFEQNYAHFLFHFRSIFCDFSRNWVQKRSAEPIVLKITHNTACLQTAGTTGKMSILCSRLNFVKMHDSSKSLSQQEKTSFKTCSKR